MSAAQQACHLRGSVWGGRRARRVPTWKRGVDDSDGDQDEHIPFSPSPEEGPPHAVAGGDLGSAPATVREAQWVRTRTPDCAVVRPAPRELWTRPGSPEAESESKRSTPQTPSTRGTRGCRKRNCIPEGNAVIGVGAFCGMGLGLS